MKKKYSLKKNDRKISASIKKTKKNTDRLLKVNVKTAKGRKISSTNWLRRQLNDPYVKLAKERGYRSRAAFKLLEINENHGFRDPYMIITNSHSMILGKAAELRNKVYYNYMIFAIIATSIMILMKIF